MRETLTRVKRGEHFYIQKCRDTMVETGCLKTYNDKNVTIIPNKLPKTEQY